MYLVEMTFFIEHISNQAKAVRRNNLNPVISTKCGIAARMEKSISKV